MSLAVLLFAAGLAFVPQDDKDALETIQRAVAKHFDRYDAMKRQEIINELAPLWKALPTTGELRDRGLIRIIRDIETTTARFPLDPNRPELAAPDRFHVRAYEISRRRLRLLMENAVEFSRRTPEAREAILVQINAVFDEALAAFLAKAADDDVEELLRKKLEELRTDVHLKAVDDPFSGYLKPLSPEALKELRGKIVRAAEARPKDQNLVHDSLRALYEIGRTYDSARFATYDEDKALLDEVKAWRAEEKKRSAPQREGER